MAEANDKSVGSAVESYWITLPKYIAAVEHAVNTSHKTAGYPASSARHYWASVLFTRLCAVSQSILHLCPGSPVNKDGAHWDFSALAPLINNLVRAALLLFYLGTEVISDDESRTRILVLQLFDCNERLSLFRNVGSLDEQISSFLSEAGRIRKDLSSDEYFATLPATLRERILQGDTTAILTDDQILDRLDALDQTERGLLGLISSHAELTPLAFYRTGEGNRGRGEPNQTDILYMAMALELAFSFIARADADMLSLFQETLSVRSESHTDGRDDRLESTVQHVRKSQGEHLDQFAGEDDSGAPLLCSHCFYDEGLRLSCEEIGQKDLSTCPNCGSQSGMKLNKRLVAVLADQFFVSGSIQRTEYGGFPAVQFNKQRSTSLEVAAWVQSDLQLIADVLKVGFFPYIPRLWMVGEVEPLKALRASASRPSLINRILDEYPGRLLTPDECFYRIRKNPANPGDFKEYDSPPEALAGKGRFDTLELPILYGSQDLEVCLHECRVASDDQLYVATFVPRKTLKLLNLAAVPAEENVDEFESLDMALHMLFLAGNHSYEISRDIAGAARECGFDGIIYPSYFTLLRTGATPFETTYGLSHRRFAGFSENAQKYTIPNVALFGRPLSEDSIAVRCIDRVTLRKVDYSIHFGPLFTNRILSDATEIYRYFEIKAFQAFSEAGIEAE